jgi:hypothetical protein
VVDEWIAFRETLPIGAPIPPSVTTSWDTRFEEWQAMKGRGELADLGRPYIPQAMPAPRIALRGIVVKQEAALDHAPNADPGHVAPVSKRKRDQSKSPTASSSRPHKRRANSLDQTQDMPEVEDMTDKMLGAQERHADGLAPELLASHESSPDVEQSEPSPSSLKGDSDGKGTMARLRECEGASRKHSNLIQSQGFKLVVQEGLVADHAIRLGGLEQAQARFNTRVGTVRDELAVHKTRIEDCQKAVNHNNQEMDISQLKTSLKTKVRVQRERVDELVTRVAELEASNGGGVSSGLKDQGIDDESLSQVEAQVTDLTKRIVMLEKNQQAGFDKVHRRLDALEVNNSQRASTLATSRALFGRLGAEQETRYMQQEWAAEPSRITLSERQAAEQRSRLFRHATEQEARFPQYERAAQPSRTAVANGPIQVWNRGRYTTPAPAFALVPAHAPAPALSPALVHVEHTYPGPGHYHDPHQAAQPQPSQGYYRAATRER